MSETSKSKHKMGLTETVDWYNENAEAYAKDLDTAIRFAAESVDDFLKVLPPDPYVLEAGCGPGRETKLFRERGIRTLGVDLSQGLLEVARKRNPDTTYIKADFRDLPLEDATVDGVWSHASLVHLETIEDVKKTLREFCRVLKSNGLVFIKVKIQTGAEKTAVISDTLSKHDRFFRYYTLEELKRLISEAGFTFVDSKITEDGHGRKEIQWLQVIARKTT